MTTASAASDDAFEGHLHQGGEFLRDNRIDDAKAAFGAALKLHPESTKALGLLGLACFRTDAFAEALPVYKKLVELQPSDASQRLNLGLVHLKLGAATEAIEQLKACRELDPSQTRAVSYLGLAHARNGEYADAYEAFLRANDDDLAREMEQYLDSDELQAIRAQVVPRADDEFIDGASTDSANEDDVVVDEDVVEITNGVVKEEMSEASAISVAVKSAVAANAAEVAVTKTASGHVAPQPLSQFATTGLVRPQDGGTAFEISEAGLLIVRISTPMMARTQGLIASGGELSMTPATRHIRGAPTDEPYGDGDQRMHEITGSGYMICDPCGEQFTSLALDNDILYLREDLVFAYQDQLRWENGHVPGSGGALEMVQFRGEGCVAYRSSRPLLAVKLAPEQISHVDSRFLGGWIGRVVPQVVKREINGGAAGQFIECSGEGVILLETPGEGQA